MGCSGSHVAVQVQQGREPALKRGCVLDAQRGA
jgi:hypothetical protein